MKLPKVGELAMRQLSRELLKADGDPTAFLKTRHGKQLLNGCSKGDLKFFNDPQWLRGLYESMVEAFHQGSLGVKSVVEEHQIFVKPWALPFSGFDSGNLCVWHGAQDLICRVSNAFALKKMLPKAELEVFSGSGHCVMFERLDKLVAVLS
jgi:hypothetical protein